MTELSPGFTTKYFKPNHNGNMGYRERHALNWFFDIVCEECMSRGLIRTKGNEEVMDVLIKEGLMELSHEPQTKPAYVEVFDISEKGRRLYETYKMLDSI